MPIIYHLLPNFISILSQARSYLMTSKLAYKEVNLHKEERKKKKVGSWVFGSLINP
jgi:hypothetical protein